MPQFLWASKDVDVRSGLGPCGVLAGTVQHHLFFASMLSHLHVLHHPVLNPNQSCPKLEPWQHDSRHAEFETHFRGSDWSDL